MGVTLSDASPRQARALANVPKIASFMSMLGSCYIMVDIIRLPKRTIYHRLVFWMNVCDFMSLTAWLMTTWPIPKNYPADYDVPIYNAVGNQRTCNMQGFLGQMSIGTVFYSGCLMCYFMLAIKYGWKEKRINDAHVEKTMHSLAFVLTVGTAVAALFMDLYNPVGWQCWIGSVPQGCSDGWDLTLFEDIQECDRGANANFFLWWFFYFPLWLTILGASFAVGMVYSAFWDAEKKAEKWKIKGKDPSVTINTAYPTSQTFNDSQNRYDSQNKTDSEVLNKTESEVQNSAFNDSCLNTTVLNDSYLNSSALNNSALNDSALNSAAIDYLNTSSPINNNSLNNKSISGGDSVNSEALEQSSSRSKRSLLHYTNPKSALKGAAKAVKQSYRKGKKKLKGISEKEEDEVRRRKKKAKRTKKQRLVISQAMLYTGSFYVAWVFPSLLRIHEVTASSDEGVQYHWVILSACFVPLQGLMNFIIYIRPKYIRISAERKKARLRRIKEKEMREKLNLPTETSIPNPLRKRRPSKKALQRDISRPRIKTNFNARSAKLASLRQFSGVSLSSSDDMPGLSVYGGGSESGGSVLSSGDSRSQMTTRAGSSKSLTRGGSSKEFSMSRASSTGTFFEDEADVDMLKRSNHDLPPLIEPPGGSSSFAFDSEEIQLVMEHGEKKSFGIEPPVLEEDLVDSEAEDDDSSGPPPLDEHDTDGEDIDDDDDDSGPPELHDDLFSEDEESFAAEDSDESDDDGRNSIHMLPFLMEQMEKSTGSISLYRDEDEAQNDGQQKQDDWEKAREAFYNSASSLEAGNLLPQTLPVNESDTDSENKGDRRGEGDRRGDPLSKSTSHAQQRPRALSTKNKKRSKSQPRATERKPRRASGEKKITANLLRANNLSRRHSLELETPMIPPPAEFRRGASAGQKRNKAMAPLIHGKTAESETPMIPPPPKFRRGKSTEQKPMAHVIRGTSIDSDTPVMPPPSKFRRGKSAGKRPSISMPRFARGKSLDSHKKADNTLSLTTGSLHRGGERSGTNNIGGQTVAMPTPPTQPWGESSTNSKSDGQVGIVQYGSAVGSRNRLIDSESDSSSEEERVMNRASSGGGYLGNLLIAMDNPGGQVLNLAVDNPRSHDDDDHRVATRKSLDRRSLMNRGWMSFRGSFKKNKSSSSRASKDSDSEQHEDGAASKRILGVQSAHGSALKGGRSDEEMSDLSRRSKMRLARGSNGSNSSRMNIGRSVRNFATDISTTLIAASRESDWLDHLDGLVSEHDDDDGHDDDDDIEDFF